MDIGELEPWAAPVLAAAAPELVLTRKSGRTAASQPVNLPAREAGQPGKFADGDEQGHSSCSAGSVHARTFLRSGMTTSGSLGPAEGGRDYLLDARDGSQDTRLSGPIATLLSAPQ
jgi:hypothetical protein